MRLPERAANRAPGSRVPGAERGRVLRDVLIAIAAAAALLAVGIQVGRDVERIGALRAESLEPGAETKILTRIQAWNGIYGCPRPPREDLQPPGRGLPVRGAKVEVRR